MILSAWKPKIKINQNKKCILYYTLCDTEDIYKRGSSNIKIIYKCDCKTCKNPNRIFSIDRQHLSEKRSKTVNEKKQICRSCQTSGINNPKYGDNRTWLEMMGEDKSNILKKNLSNRSTGENNPSKKDCVKIKKNQLIINFENVKKITNKRGFELEDIKGVNKFAILTLRCKIGHLFELKWVNLKSNKQCRFCYYESIKIPLLEIGEFEKYSKKVRYLTRSNFLKYKKFIHQSIFKEVDSSNYHIDHIYSISDGFLNKVKPEIISSFINLRVISKKENLTKGRKSEISLEKLMESYQSSIQNIS
jgi:hypothetical protein